MKNTDAIEVLGRAVSILEKYLPVKEHGFLMEYLSAYEHLKAKDDRQKQNYQAKAEYHREKTRQWRQDNKEKHDAYQKAYYTKKRAEKKQNG